MQKCSLFGSVVSDPFSFIHEKKYDEGVCMIIHIHALFPLRWASFLKLNLCADGSHIPFNDT